MLVATDSNPERLRKLKADLEDCFSKMSIYGKIIFGEDRTVHEYRGVEYHLYAFMRAEQRDDLWGFFLGYVWGRGAPSINS